MDRVARRAIYRASRLERSLLNTYAADVRLHGLLFCDFSFRNAFDGDQYVNAAILGAGLMATERVSNVSAGVKLTHPAG